VRIAGDHALVGGIDQEIEVFQNNGADQSRVPFWLDDGGKGAITSEDFHIHGLGGGPDGTPAIGVFDADFAGDP
jgi:hypothetical protein